MLQLIYQQQYLLFVIIAFALVFSLTFHEYGHGYVASLLGDNTALKAGRLTLNPVPHIDPVGLLMVLFIGIGYAKPVPTNPRNYRTRWGIPLVAAAGPAMNLILGVLVINIYYLGLKFGLPLFKGEEAYLFFVLLAQINMMLMLFNLIPFGPLDGHYILPYAMPRQMAIRFVNFNQRYGGWFLLALIAINFLFYPIFIHVWELGEWLVNLFTFVR